MHKETVMTLDAGGTNFVFTAIKNAAEIAAPVTLPSAGNNLDNCLKNMITGFEMISGVLKEKPDAISFAFPGPADYGNGIIGDLGNLPGFRGGIALGPMLREKFGIPVFINNDGDLFAYGESMFGLLPELNQKLKKAGSIKQYKNFIGITLGTGFGGGIVRNNELFLGDNGAAGEVWLLHNPLIENSFAEESISARAIVREYIHAGGDDHDGFQAMDVYNIAHGKASGNKEAALHSFHIFGQSLGNALVQAVTLVDGIVAIGGGLSNAWDLFSPSMFEVMNGTCKTVQGNTFSRLVANVYDLENPDIFEEFAIGSKKEITVPFSVQKLQYDPLKRTGVGLSKLGASKAISLGAYAYAVNALKG